ncbi:MAG: winged helix DNA-binding protein [Bacteroidetes bacterium]|nr:winged helix DNA-binding protein [Bacteroidota bacterium]
MADQFDIHRSLGYLIAHAFRAASASIQLSFKANGLEINKNHWFIMAKTHFFADNCLRQVEVVGFMQGDKTRVTRAVGDLVKWGWIHQEIDPNDRRNRLLSITPKGQAVMPTLIECVVKTHESLTKDIDPQDLEIARKVLMAFINNGNSIISTT